MKDTLPLRVRFGAFELDLKAGELRSAADPSAESGIVLPDQPFRLLVMLVERAGEIATREEIRKQFWPNDTIVEFDHSINVAIGKLRKALGDSADQPKYIETLARRGYRLMVPVERVESSSGDGLRVDTVYSGQDERSARINLESGGLEGKTISHYRVLHVIGGGGMGVVYKAEDLKLGRAVALKFLPEGLGADPLALERFEREARAASSLDHPNICSIYEFGEHEGQSFLVMQLLQGQTLRGFLASGGLTDSSSGALGSLHRLLDIAIQIADGLEAAHKQGIVHRDIKPANIFLTASGQVKILDFGLAKLVSAVEENRSDGFQPGAGAAAAATQPARSAPVDTTLTQHGVALGTAGYMSPEQVRGDKLDARTDLFSFGLVLYEMATGQKAFAAEDAAALKDAILNQTPTPALKLNPRLPHKLGAIIDRCLQKDRNLRYQHASELCADLKSLKRDSEGALSKAAAMALVVFGVIFVAAFALGVRWYFARPRSEPFSKFQISQVTDTGLASVAVLSPDGKFILNVENDNGQQSLWLRNVQTGSDTQVMPPAPVLYASLNFSPDGNYIYFRRGIGRTPNTLDEFRAPLLGGEPQMVVHDIDTNVTFSPDGSRMAFFRDNNPAAGRMRLISTSADGKDEQILLEAKLFSPYRIQPVWSPDGRVIAFTEDFAEGAFGRVQLLDVGSRQVRTLYSTNDAEFSYLAWADTGNIAVVYNSKSNLHQGQIGLISYPGGTFRTLTNDTTNYSGTGVAGQVSASATGREIVAVQSKETDRIEIMTFGTGIASDLKEIMSVHDRLSGISWTPDGKILYARRNRLVLVNEDGAEQTVFASDPLMPLSVPDVCRDGRHVVFIWGFNDGTFFHNIGRVDIDGSGATQLTSGETYFNPRCSPDSQELVSQDYANRQFTMPLAGGAPEVFMREWSISNLPWSPDGNKIGMVTLLRDQKGAYEHKIVLYSFDSRSKKYLPYNPNFSANWSFEFSPDGKSVAYAIREKRGDNIWLQPLDGSPGRAITDFPEDSISVIRFSPDGKHLALIHSHTESDVVLIRDATGGK